MCPSLPASCPPLPLTESPSICHPPPLPPSPQIQEALAIADAAAAHAGGAGGAGHAAPLPPGMTEGDLRGANPVLMALRTLMPWFNVGQQPEYGGEGGEGSDGDYDGRVEDA